MASPQERIIEAALTLIASEGMSQVSMAKIAQTAGVARQTLYNHYADIPAIITDVVHHHNTQAIAQLDQAMSVVDGPADAIRQLIRHVVAANAHAGHAPDVMGALPASAREALSSFDDAVERHLAAALEAGVASGEFRSDINVALDSVIIRHGIAGVVDVVAANPEAGPRVVADAVRTLLAGVTAAP